MAKQTYFVVQEFHLVQKRWQPKIPREVAGRDIAARVVERSRARNIPALAFARAGDPTTGDFDEAELIASFDVPSEFMGDNADV